MAEHQVMSCSHNHHSYLRDFVSHFIVSGSRSRHERLLRNSVRNMKGRPPKSNLE